MDKDWLKGDSAQRYYGVNENKSYNEYRKKMFVTMGISPSFSKDATSYDFVERSLSDGLTKNEMASISNEIRRGSYDRGIGTAKGGEQTKFIIRVFNATRVTMDDCKSKRGISVTFTLKNYRDFIDRYMLDSNGKLTLLTEDVISSYIGKTVTLRSPMYCKTPNGLCYTCVGNNFRVLDQNNIGMLAVNIGSKFTSINMKSMHFSGIKSDTLVDISKYFVV